MGFKLRVLELVRLVPRGKVTTYKELARAVGKPLAWRAVARALAQNPHPVEIPCHRVVRSDGGVGGYSLGVGRKIRLLRAEGVVVERGRIDLGKLFFRFDVSSSVSGDNRSSRGPASGRRRLSPALS